MHTVGGKCASLGELSKAGATVPAGFAITTAAHAAFLEASGVEDRVRQIVDSVDHEDVTAVHAASEELRALIESCPVPESVDSAIRAAHVALCEFCGTERLPVAVRSSATAEDHSTASFAGQLETYLWVVGGDLVLDAVRRCWSGLYTPHALTYRRSMGFEGQRALMSVGVQQMVEARAAGVMFTLNPLNGDRSKVAVESCFGLGEGIVQGVVNPDRFLVDKVAISVVERTVSSKDLAYRFDAGAGEVVATPVDESLRDSPSISEDEVLELARTGKAIERHYGSPQDIEWAIGATAGADRGERLYVLQSRDETVWCRSAPEPVPGSGSALDRVLSRFTGGAGRGAG